MINMSTQRAFIERSVSFEEEPIPAVEIRESSSPPPPLNVSEETNEFYYYDISYIYYLISYPIYTKIPNWEAIIIPIAREPAGNPSDPRRTRSQYESALPMKDPLFVEKCCIMVE